jgi:preprotein translocase subunit SecB
MNESSFQFKNFKIKKSFFEVEDQDQSDPSKFSLTIAPSGVFEKSSGEFKLYLNINIKNNELNISINTEGVFEFKDNIDDSTIISNYLFVNAPAIIFPYIRAYIGTLTTLSGGKAIILPTMNLVSLRDDLEENTEFI